MWLMGHQDQRTNQLSFKEQNKKQTNKNKTNRRDFYYYYFLIIFIALYNSKVWAITHEEIWTVLSAL